MKQFIINLLASRILQILLIILIIIISFSTVFFLSFYDPTANFSKFIPGMDREGSDYNNKNNKAVIGEYYKKFDNEYIYIKGRWPQFRGFNRDNIYEDENILNENSLNKNPDILWEIDLGEGHAAPAVYDGRVYLLDYDENIKSDVLRCFALADGKELWRRWYKVPIKRNHGFSRTIPAVNDKYAVTIGPKGHVMCVESVTGDYLWGIDIEKEYLSEIPLWYTGQCPIIDNDTTVIATCGKSILIGVDCRTGDVLWETPNPENYKMSHSSIMPMKIYGKKTYVYCAIGGMVGISAEKNDRGKLLWQTKEWDAKVIAPSPVGIGDGRIFVTAGYGAGSMMFNIIKDGDNFRAESLYKYKPNEGLACEQQTPIIYKGFLYGIMPKDGGIYRNQFVCYDPSGNIIWTSSKDKRFGLGPFILINDKFVILSDDGTLTIINASTVKYDEIINFKVMEGRDAWGPIAVAGSKMLLRDSAKMVCIELK